MIIIKTQYRYNKPSQLADITAIYKQDNCCIEGVDKNNVCRELGIYSNYARAKEVLIEIEERIKILEYIKCFGNMQYLNIDIKGSLQDLFIYTMPEE